MLFRSHEQFINTVKQGRGDRLSKTTDLFSGLFWTGEKSLELGLIDGFGSASYVAREIIQAKDIVNFTPQHDVFDKFAKRLGAEIATRFGAWAPTIR